MSLTAGMCFCKHVRTSHYKYGLLMMEEIVLEFLTIEISNILDKRCLLQIWITYSGKVSWSKRFTNFVKNLVFAKVLFMNTQ